MILHYLGLDHIGHLEGPFSSKISWKLNEMDSVIKVINHQLEIWVRMNILRGIFLGHVVIIIF